MGHMEKRGRGCQDWMPASRWESGRYAIVGEGRNIQPSVCVITYAWACDDGEGIWTPVRMNDGFKLER